LTGTEAGSEYRQWWSVSRISPEAEEADYRNRQTDKESHTSEGHHLVNCRPYSTEHNAVLTSRTDNEHQAAEKYRTAYETQSQSGNRYSPPEKPV